MTARILIRRSLRFHARAHFGVVLGAAIGSAALIGALLVGDSVRQSLREQALARLGGTYFAMSSGDRFFKEHLHWRFGEPKPTLTFRSRNRILQTTTYPPSTARYPALLLVG